jgi:vitamin B12 transporter
MPALSWTLCHWRHAALVIIILPLLVNACRAQPSPEPPLTETVFVTATRSAEPLTDILADVTIIDADEIARAGAQSLAELLARAPGVEIATSGGPGSTSSIFLRGANSDQTLVLIDGLRVSSSTDGATAIEAIPLDQIDHIEILRGPASSLYGADAIGGVIQIFTRRSGGALSANANAGYGTYRTAVASGGMSGGDGPWRFALQAGVNRSTGFNAIGNPANINFSPDREDGYRNDSASGSASFRIVPDQELSAQFFHSRENTQFDAGPDFDARTITTLTSYAVDSRNRLASFWTSRLEAGEGDDNSVSQTGFGNSPFKTRQRQYTWQNDFTLPQGMLSIAFERREERVDNDANFPVTARNTNAAVAVLQWHDGPQAVQANLRRDDSTQYGGQTTGALEYGYAFGAGFRASASYGTAFKAPTFNDLYYPGFSNPALKPETAHNLEAALHYANGGVAAGITVYDNRVQDLIVFECDASFNCAPQNVANATLRGVTLELAAHVAGFAAKGSVDFQRPEDDATGNLLPRRARQHAAVTVLQTWRALRVGAELIASSARFDDAANTRRMGAYATVNLTADYAFAYRWVVFARLDNIFDKHYELAADYNTPGASVFAGIRYRY